MGKFDDFVPTISDSEEDVPDLEVEDEQEVKPEPEKKKSKRAKKLRIQEKDESKDKDLNPDFVFDADGGETATDFEGWDFKGDDTEDDQIKKDVDLDGIIRRKGGLVQVAGTKLDEDEEDDEEDDEDEDEENGGNEVEENEQDEDLAMDGFGMGFKNSDDEEEDQEESESESEVDDDTNQSEKAEVLNGDKDDEKVEEEEEEDSPEEIAKFYAPSSEGETAKSQTHLTFNSLGLSRPVLKGLAALGYGKPTPIQSATIPIALLGKDIIAGAVTGSGKTAAYMIPVIERLLYKPTKMPTTKIIVLAPTRELAIQVSDVGKKIAKFVSGITFGLAVGGLNLRQQEQELKTRPDIVIATPGRFIDHLRNSPSFSADSVEILIVDEADRMLEEGFQKELTEILDILPSKRQTLLFSATMNSKIKSLIQLSLRRPVRIMIDPPKQAATGLVQEFVRIRKRDNLKPSILFNILKKFSKDQRIVIFVARKEMAHRLRIILGLLGLRIAELHGSLTQEQRLKSVNDFKSLTVPILICTDLASRGLDIPKIEVVINYDMPKNHEVYLHRVGRTARGGREGKSISFVGESSNDRSIVKDAIKNAEVNKETNTRISKTLGREVNWKEVEEINKLIEAKQELLEEILEEEKAEKQMLQAEMEVRKGENLLKYKNEIQARPRRTWFEKESEKRILPSQITEAVKAKVEKKTNSRKRKQKEAQEDFGERRYKKTQNDRVVDQKRTMAKQKNKGEKKKGRPTTNKRK